LFFFSVSLRFTLHLIWVSGNQIITATKHGFCGREEEEEEAEAGRQSSVSSLLLFLNLFSLIL